MIVVRFLITAGVDESAWGYSSRIVSSSSLEYVRCGSWLGLDRPDGTLSKIAHIFVGHCVVGAREERKFSSP